MFIILETSIKLDFGRIGYIQNFRNWRFFFLFSFLGHSLSVLRSSLSHKSYRIPISFCFFLNSISISQKFVVSMRKVSSFSFSLLLEHCFFFYFALNAFDVAPSFFWCKLKFCSFHGNCLGTAHFFNTGLAEITMK